jgi:hypothetical protein
VLRTKSATISFRGRPLPGSLHQLYEWAILDELTVEQISHGISWSLNQSLKQDARYMRRI